MSNLRNRYRYRNSSTYDFPESRIEELSSCSSSEDDYLQNRIRDWNEDVSGRSYEDDRTPSPEVESPDESESEIDEDEDEEDEGVKVKNEEKRKDKVKVKERAAGISILDIFRILFVLIASSCALSYYMTENSILWGYRPWFTRMPVLMRYLRGPINLTPSQLSLYNGTSPSLPIYLSINNTIFDVSANPHTYGAGGGYNFFAGRDATRAFVTGCFKEDLTPDLRGVEEMYMPVEDADEIAEERAMSAREKKVRREREGREAREKVRKQVEHWEGFFRNHEKYFEVGRVVGGPGVEGVGEKRRELCESAKKARPKRSKLREKERKGKK